MSAYFTLLHFAYLQYDDWNNLLRHSWSSKFCVKGIKVARWSGIELRKTYGRFLFLTCLLSYLIVLNPLVDPCFWYVNYNWVLMPRLSLDCNLRVMKYGYAIKTKSFFFYIKKILDISKQNFVDLSYCFRQCFWNYFFKTATQLNIRSSMSYPRCSCVYWGSRSKGKTFCVFTPGCSFW